MGFADIEGWHNETSRFGIMYAFYMPWKANDDAKMVYDSYATAWLSLTDTRWQHYTLWLDSILWRMPYGIGLVQYNQVEAKYSLTYDGNRLALLWDNQVLHVDSPIDTSLSYHTLELLQWERFSQVDREALNAHNWKSSREAEEPDRGCPFNEANFQKLDASYVGPKI